MTSDYRFKREYRGKVKALVLDWSGTTADAYVIAPAIVFVEVFRNQGVQIAMNCGLSNCPILPRLADKS